MTSEAQIILEAIRGMTEAGQTAFMWYMFSQIFENAMIAVVFLGLGWMGYKLVRKWQEYEFDQ